MSPGDSEHFNPLLVTVLPQERRARHPYQICVMGLLFTLGLYQITVGAVPISAVNLLDEFAYLLLNWVSMLAGAAGMVAAFIPERVVRPRLFGKVFAFDATYTRLWLEFGAHALLLAVWSTYAQAAWASYGPAKGYGLGLAIGLWLGAAALCRIIQILLTMHRARTFTRRHTAIVGKDQIHMPPGAYDVQ